MILTKPLILLIANTFLITAFIFNTWFNWQLYKYNLNIVPVLQNNSFLASQPFIILMNIVSNIFNPIVCAGYILAFYLLSHRRFQILVFLIWFIFLSVFLSYMKSLIQQCRPYWIPDSGVQMLQWTCYTQYGCPSGHSMLGLILIEFIIRYYCRQFFLQTKAKVILMLLGLFLQGLVVFSRIILGMHSINQVLFGILLGFYFLLMYYLYMQKLILKICLKVCNIEYKKKTLTLTTLLIFTMILISVSVSYLPNYNKNQDYFNQIQTFQKCKGIARFSSFQYKCLQDSALIMAAFGVILGLVFLKNQEKLMRVVTYPRNSKKYILRIILSAIIAIIPVAFFMNPLWKKINIQDDQYMALLLYFLQGAGLMSGCFVLVGLAPAVLSRLKLEDYFTHHEGREFLQYQKSNDEYLQRSLQSKFSSKQKKSLQNYDSNQSISIPKK